MLLSIDLIHNCLEMAVDESTLLVLVVYDALQALIQIQLVSQA